MKAADTFRDILVRLLGGLCAVIFAVLVCDVLWGVISRHFFTQPAWTEELARFLMVWLALLGGVLAYADDRHLGVDVLVARLHGDARRIARLVSHLCVLGFSLGLLVIGGAELFRSRWESGQVLPALDIRKAWFYLVLPVGGVLITLLALGKTLACLKSETGEEDAS